jgi:hypothetical protein
MSAAYALWNAARLIQRQTAQLLQHMKLPTQRTYYMYATQAHTRVVVWTKQQLKRHITEVVHTCSFQGHPPALAVQRS